MIYDQSGRTCNITVCQKVGRGLAPFGDFIYPLGDGKDLVTQIWEILPASGDTIRNPDNFSCSSLTKPCS